MLFDNNRLSHWFGGALFSWVMMFLLLGLPVFHLWLKVPTSKIVTFIGICCAVQLAITPWLFSAKSTRQNPSGRTAQRAAALNVLFSVTALLFFYYVRDSWPEDADTHQFTSIAMVLTVLFGIVGLIRFCLVLRHTKDSTAE